MKSEVKKVSSFNIAVDVLVLTLFEDEKIEESAAIQDINICLHGKILDLVKNKEITGKFDEMTVLYGYGELQAKKVLITGLGKKKTFSTDRLRHVAGSAVRQAKRLHAKKMGLKFRAYVLKILQNDGIIIPHLLIIQTGFCRTQLVRYSLIT